MYALKFASHFKGTISRDEFGFCGLYSLIQRQPLKLQYKHQANTLLSMNNLTQTGINRNIKPFALKIIGALVRSSSVNFCQKRQKKSILYFLELYPTF
jgi:hypothetical protein